MTAYRFPWRAAGTSLLVALSACSGVTQFSGAQPVLIAGTPPPPAPPKEERKPPPRVELRNNKIEFDEKIQFEADKAIIKQASFSLLHDIADVIKKHPRVKKLSIEGHASAEGDAKHNKTLSDERAKAVMEHLVSKEGVAPARLVSKGWGAEKPIASNDTEEGREKNRRVEFLVTEQNVTSKTVEIDPATGKERVIDKKKETVKAPDATPSAKEQAKKPEGKK